MSTEPAPDRTPTNRLELSRAEAWVVHHVVLAHLLDEDADAQPWWALEVAEKLEAGENRFTAFEAWRLRCALVEYADRDATPEADVALSVAVVDRIDSEFDGPPAALC
ncbi:hypothetical protein G9C85_07330 [Halorubellus sp. JP-L1]|uniref:DUF7853 family protein n=1 Tax=Halorubellus sp. JP-L1 TaxID=2715753 RepID=UPI00140B0AE5|nr:hypothetical protein [Halorubellus sp. JP-L1]NHN41449.1 hypothetical protein [Halorubellus sp. JP-L1]